MLRAKLVLLVAIFFRTFSAGADSKETIILKAFHTFVEVWARLQEWALCVDKGTSPPRVGNSRIQCCFDRISS